MINWGILGFGGMGIRFAEAIKETSNSKLLSTASKSGKTFEDFKNQNRIILGGPRPSTTIVKSLYSKVFQVFSI